LNTRMDTIMICRAAASRMRIQVLQIALSSGSKGAHLGGCLSVIELLATLYCGVMNIKPGEPDWTGRDRFILSKGNGSLALYTALEASNLISEEELLTFGQNGGPLSCAASLVPALGLEFSNGTLGFGLSYAVGLALAAKRSLAKYHVYVLLGDGECNEGSVWEAAMSASHYKLSNLTVVVDLNGLQSDGKTCNILNIQLEKIWKGFGWEVIMVDDGHDIAQLLDAFMSLHDEVKPRVIIARTIKGKGVSFMENNNRWHHNHISKEEFDAAMKEFSNGSQHDTN
jgi:transketolase